MGKAKKKKKAKKLRKVFYKLQEFLSSSFTSLVVLVLLLDDSPEVHASLSRLSLGELELLLLLFLFHLSHSLLCRLLFRQPPLAQEDPLFSPARRRARSSSSFSFLSIFVLVDPPVPGSEVQAPFAAAFAVAVAAAAPPPSALPPVEPQLAVPKGRRRPLGSRQQPRRHPSAARAGEDSEVSEVGDEGRARGGRRREEGLGPGAEQDGDADDGGGGRGGRGGRGRSWGARALVVLAGGVASSFFSLFLDGDQHHRRPRPPPARRGPELEELGPPPPRPRPRGQESGSRGGDGSCGSGGSSGCGSRFFLLPRAPLRLVPGPDARGLPLGGRREQPGGQRAKESGDVLPGPGWLEGRFFFFEFFFLPLLLRGVSLASRLSSFFALSLSLFHSSFSKKTFYLCCEPPDGVGVLEPGPADPDPSRFRKRRGRSRSRWRRGSSDRRKRRRRRRRSTERKSVACHRALVFPPRPPPNRQAHAVVGLRTVTPYLLPPLPRREKNQRERAIQRERERSKLCVLFSFRLEFLFAFFDRPSIYFLCFPFSSLRGSLFFPSLFNISSRFDTTKT